MLPPGSGAPPTISNLTVTCTPAGSQVDFDCNKVIFGATLSVTLTDATGEPVWSDGFGTNANARSFTIAGTPDGSYTLTADNGEAVLTKSVTILCGGLLLTQVSPLSPVAPATTGSVRATVIQGTAPYFAYVDNAAPTALTGGAINLTGLAPGAHTLYATDSATPPGWAMASFTIATAATLGCTTPRALNYDPAATQDDTPSLCEFVAVDEAPAQLVAAHLPIPLVLRASPTAAGLASLVVVYLETADTLAGPWVEFGRLKAACDREARVAFNLSEAAKSLLRIGAPVESGADPSLSALLRVRYEVLDPLTLLATSGDTLTPSRVLNAVQQASSGATLTTPTTYATVPVGAALWASVVTYANGVVATPLVRDTDGCTPRQLVWLNRAGAWDSGFFYGRHVHGTDQADPIAFRDQAGADRYASRGTVRPTLQVYSDKVDWPTFRALRGVRDSVQVYERKPGGQYVPVLVASESYTEYQEVTDKTFQVNLTVSYPAQLIQTQ